LGVGLNTYAPQFGDFFAQNGGDFLPGKVMKLGNSKKQSNTMHLRLSEKWISFGLLSSVIALAACASTAHAGLTHRYTFTTDASDSVGGANGTLQGIATVSGGQLQLNNPPFSPSSFAGGYLSLPVSILPTSGSVTIEQWFTFTGSGFFTEAYTFSDRNGGANPPGSNVGQYLMHTISNPQGGPVPAGGGSSVAQSLAGYLGGETRAFGTTPGLGAGGGGYLDDGGTYMAATVIDGTAGTLSYYVFRVSDGLGGLQQMIPAIPLSSYSFTDAFLGRSPFDADNWTSGSVDEFRIFNDARSIGDIYGDFAAGPNVVPEPASLTLLGLGGLALFLRRRSSGIVS
jgi:PEP-CTERM motif